MFHSANPAYPCRIFGQSNCEPGNNISYPIPHLYFISGPKSYLDTCKHASHTYIIFLKIHKPQPHQIMYLTVEIKITIIKATGQPCCGKTRSDLFIVTLAARLQRPDAWSS